MLKKQRNISINYNYWILKIKSKKIYSQIKWMKEIVNYKIAITKVH